MNTEILPTTQPNAFNQAQALLQGGAAVAFPTDTVYGLGTSAFEAQAIEQLFVIKGRENSKAIAVLLGDSAALGQVAAGMSLIAERLAKRFWPGPLTLVVPRHPALPANLSPLPTIGVRMPDHPDAIRLLNQSGPLAVTSANLSGADNTCTAQEVYQQLQGRIPLILDGGRTPGGAPSTVVDCTGSQPQILRQGPISLEQILETIQ